MVAKGLVTLLPLLWGRPFLKVPGGNQDAKRQSHDRPHKHEKQDGNLRDARVLRDKRRETLCTQARKHTNNSNTQGSDNSEHVMCTAATS